jgi:3-carboxy-cis,cis-muconate cycloisomerase
MTSNTTHGLNAYLQSAELAALWCDEAVVAAMLRFELELVRVQASQGLVPEAHAHSIAQLIHQQFANALPLQQLAERIGAKARVSSTLAIPLVEELRAAVAAHDAGAAQSVHLHATSQDVVDTAMMLQAKASLGWIDAQLAKLGSALVAHIHTHRHTAVMGRTLLQAAVPIPLGYKFAVWLSGLQQSRAALLALALPLQYGGAAGTLHGMHTSAAPLIHELAKRLGLHAPAITWHAQRDILARLGSELAILCGVLGKLGLDIALSAQNEVAELTEPYEAGRGASSAMAHKRNPVGAMHMVQAASRAPDLAATLMRQQLSEHERALGNWQSQLFVLRDLFNVTGGALAAALEVVAGLQINTANMTRNLMSETLTHSDAAQAMMDQVLSQWANSSSGK